MAAPCWSRFRPSGGSAFRRSALAASIVARAPLAAALRPVMAPAVALPMTLVLLACPLAVFAVTRAAGLDGPLGAGLVLAAAAGPGVRGGPETARVQRRRHY
jgi:hypothetical protein